MGSPGSGASCATFDPMIFAISILKPIYGDPRKSCCFFSGAPLKSGDGGRGLKMRGWVGPGVLLLGCRRRAGTAHRFRVGAQHMRGRNMQILA